MNVDTRHPSNALADGTRWTNSRTATQNNAEVWRNLGRVEAGTNTSWSWSSDGSVTGDENDAGLFDPAMRDERYLPFEGAGADSTWMLELPTNFKSFDYGTISDVILHMRYTARDGGDPLKTAATASAAEIVKIANNGQPLQRFFSLRHEFPGEWQRLAGSSASPSTMVVDLAATRFPYFAQGGVITIRNAEVMMRSTAAAPPQATIAPGKNPQDLSKTTWTDPASPGP